MANELERFLQQAAERLRQKIEQGSAAPRPAVRGPSPPAVREAERRPMRPDANPESDQVIEARLAEADVVLRKLGPDPLSSLDTRQRPTSYIDQSDERMAGHLHDVFDHQVPQVGDTTRRISGGANQSNVKSEVSKRGHQVSEYVEILRQPNTLRAAFIAGEIFRRKF